MTIFSVGLFHVKSGVSLIFLADFAKWPVQPMQSGCWIIVIWHLHTVFLTTSLMAENSYLTYLLA